MPVTHKILVTAAVLATTVISGPPSSARPLVPSTGTAPQERASACFHAFADASFQGLDQRFCGNTGECHYVGDNWNDRIRSARTESDVKVELWDNADCTGGSIVIDRSGYGRIGAWVSAYRVT